jgi:ubiquitin-activating enzyme E1
MHEFRKREGRLPKPWSSSDAASFVALAKELNGKSANPIEPNDDLISLFAKICAGDVSPMSAAIGGFVAQEVMKACSGKFMPARQWLYFDARECLPEDTSALNEETCKPLGSRYDGQIAVFGNEFQVPNLCISNLPETSDDEYLIYLLCI